jgi:non-ribosomal peptide synthetase component F
MAITFVLDPHRPLVRTTYTGRITFREVVAYAHELVHQKLLATPQLIDARRATLTLSEEETRQISDLLASLRQRHGRAPVAFVAGNAASYGVAAGYGDLGAGGIPAFSIFEDVEAADVWITLCSASENG